jgi:hypothetical protein
MRMTSQRPKAKATPKSKSGNVFRLDLRRASLALGGLAAVLVLAFFMSSQKSSETQIVHGFGHDTRVGSVVVMPLTGDTCRQIAFNNDSGTITEGDTVSCRELTSRARKPSKDSHVGAISENFRK